jgi:transketolase
MALAEQWLAARFNRPGFPVVDHHTFVIASDGDLMEGISHEAASLAGHLGLGKLIVLYDDNQVTIDGPAELTWGDDVPGRFRAYGWNTLRADGHDLEALQGALEQARADPSRPTLIACRTHIGYQSPYQDDARAHGAPLGEDALRKTKEAYGWPPESRFLIPEAVQTRLAGLQKGWESRQAEWEAMWLAYGAQYKDLAAEWHIMMGDAHGLTSCWESCLPDFTGGKAMATRACSGAVLDSLAGNAPALLGGSADLTGSNNTRPAGAAAVRREDFRGSYIHFGVREHGMGSVLNGLALHGGTRPYGGTFLVFSDYMRPSIRLAALMGLPVIYVFTHDSIGLGEDGPTHQPVEHLAALRAIPGLAVIRPADGNETVQAWKVALERFDAPTALILTRQAVPQVAPADNQLARGAYVLREAEGGRPEVVLIASGSEVSIALEARDLLRQDGVRARVVSMPSWELYDVQPPGYRNGVLPAGVPRVAIEAGVTQGWARYVGSAGAVIGLDRFGASAPYETLYRQFGLTAAAMAARARALVRAS